MAMIHWRFLAAVLVLFSHPLAGQGSGLAGDSAALRSLRSDRYIRVQVGPARMAGRFQGIMSGEMILAVEGESRQVPLADVERLWVRGRRTGLGAVIGGALGMGGGIFLGLIADALCESSCEGSPVLPLALLGAGAGAIAGGVVGAAIPRWRQVYPP